MTFPVEIRIGPAALSAHLLCEVLAFALGFRYYQALRKRREDVISESHRGWIVIGAAFGAFVGSRLVGALEDPSGWVAAGEAWWLYAFRQKTIVGGLLGGLIGVELSKRLMGERASSGDLFTSPLMLGMIIGRVGCFLNGVYEPTFGLPTSLPWGMDLGDGIPRHPVALYEIAFLGLLWMGLAVLTRRFRLRSGYQFQGFMVAYLLFRLALDAIKPGYRFAWGLGTIQVACLLGIAYYGPTIYRLFTAPRQLLESPSVTPRAKD
jgi:prolipoprotein diacylglyceryltransferase